VTQTGVRSSLWGSMKVALVCGGRLAQRAEALTTNRSPGTITTAS
jgi:hypothetical protein